MPQVAIRSQPSLNLHKDLKMADQIKQIAFKEFTPSEITAGTPFNVQTGATDAYVIKSIEATQKIDTAESAIEATATVGLTTDFNNGKYVSLGNVAKQGKTGSTGNVIVDSNSTFSIRPTAKTINFIDTVVDRFAYVSGSSGTEITIKTPTVNGLSEPAEAAITTSATSFGSSIVSAGFVAGRPNQFITLVENTKYTPTKTLLLAEHHNGTDTHTFTVCDYNGTTNYYTDVQGYRQRDFDGRFVYNHWSGTSAGVWDALAPASVTMSNGGTQSRALTTYPNHFFMDYKNEAGDAISLGSAGSYPRMICNYFTDVGKRGLLVSPSMNSYGVHYFELPDWDYSDSGGGPWAQANITNVPTTKYYQIGNKSNSQQTNIGPTSNRYNTSYVTNALASNMAQMCWYIGTSAASTTKRIVFMQNGDNSTTTNRVYFLLADFETISTSNSAQIGGQNEAYGITPAELKSTFGWATDAGWINYSSVLAYIRPDGFGSLTGSAARWDANSRFHLDKDVLYFTNRMAHGTGEGPVIAWNLKTNVVTGAITWADYDDASGANLPNPDNKNYPSHMQYLLTPTTTEINARTYTNAPSLTVRISGVHEDRS